MSQAELELMSDKELLQAEGEVNAELVRVAKEAGLYELRDKIAEEWRRGKAEEIRAGVSYNWPVQTMLTAIDAGEIDAFLTGDGLLHGSSHMISALRFHDRELGNYFRSEILKRLDVYQRAGALNGQRNSLHFELVFFRTPYPKSPSIAIERVRQDNSAEPVPPNNTSLRPCSRDPHGKHNWKGVDTTDGYTALATLRCEGCGYELDPWDWDHSKMIASGYAGMFGREIAALEIKNSLNCNPEAQKHLEGAKQIACDLGEYGN